MKKVYVVIIFILIGLLFAGCEIDPNAKYKVTYYGNGSTSGYPPIDNNEYTAGMEASVLGKSSLIKAEHTFQGWNTKADGTGTPYVEGNKIKIINQNIFLHAKWEQE